MDKFIVIFNLFAFFYLMFIVIIRGWQFAVLKSNAKQQNSEDSNFKINKDKVNDITIIIPAYNEANIIVDTIRSMLTLDYPYYKILIVNDGSTDNTLEIIKREFNLVKSSKVYKEKLKSEKVKGIYESTSFPNLSVIDKENGGKASSQNCAINFIDTELFLIVDADSIVERDTLWKITNPFNFDKDTVAVGGMIQILNDSEVDQNNYSVKKVLLPKKHIARFQIIEYLNAFLSGRMLFDRLKIMPLISGAFGAFRTDIALEVGGYKKGSLGEDFDFTMRIHRYCKKNKIKYSIHQVPDVVCFTQVPETFKDLKSQRVRWGRGLLEVLMDNLALFNFVRYGKLFWVNLYYWFYEFLAPIIELLGIIAMIMAVVLRLLNFKVAIILFFAYWLFSSTISMFILIIKAKYFNEKKYFSKKNVKNLKKYCFLDAFGYRQLNTIYKLISIVLYKTKKSWTPLTRKSIM